MTGWASRRLKKRVRGRPRRPSPGCRLVLLLGLTLSATGSATGGQAGSATEVVPFRLAFTTSMFTEVNEADARAAMKVWIMSVASERGIPVDPEPRIYSTIEEAIRASGIDHFDGLGLTTVEYGQVRSRLEFDEIAVGTNGGKTTESYVLVVHQASGWTQLPQLAGRSLNVLQNPRMSLATVWLDTLLSREGLGRSDEFFGRTTHVSKASQVALPVFFRKADACLLTRQSLELLAELNPQVGSQLRMLAFSPEVVPSGFAFRADFRSPFREQILTEMVHLAESPAGRQILLLTQADRIERHPISCLDSALELLAEHKQMDADAKASVQAPAGDAPPIGVASKTR